jgi:hypothetical protein
MAHRRQYWSSFLSDHAFVIYLLIFSIKLMNNQNSNLNSYLRYGGIIMGIIGQNIDPWNVTYTFFPLIIYLALFMIKLFFFDN